MPVFGRRPAGCWRPRASRWWARRRVRGPRCRRCRAVAGRGAGRHRAAGRGWVRRLRRHVRQHDAAVVLTSSRTIAGLQDRLQRSRARGFIPKSDLSGRDPRVDRLTVRWGPQSLILAVVGLPWLSRCRVSGSAAPECRRWGRRRDPVDLRGAGLAAALGSRVGALMLLAGGWLLGTLVPAALLVHRGPLVHLHLSYPTGRLGGSWLSRRSARVSDARSWNRWRATTG